MLYNRARTVVDVVTALWTTTKSVFQGDTNCETKEPPFYLNAAFYTCLAFAVMTGRFAADRFTLGWALAYVVPAYVVALIVVGLVAGRRYPQHCAHCDHEGCDTCSTAVGVPPARTRRLLDERLTAAGWFVDVVDDVQLDFCPAHVEQGREAAAEQRHAITWADVAWNDDPAPPLRVDEYVDGSPVLVDLAVRVPAQRRPAED